MNMKIKYKVNRKNEEKYAMKRLKWPNNFNLITCSNATALTNTVPPVS